MLASHPNAQPRRPVAAHARPGARPNTVIVVGGGASGVLLTLQLLKRDDAEVRVVLVERTGTFGRGLAYGTRDPEHLLNVVPAKMSADPDDPGQFWRWLKDTGRIAADADPFVFVARQHFGDYLAHLLTAAQGAAGSRLLRVTGNVVDLVESDSGVRAVLGDGRSFIADTAVLATGHGASLPADQATPGLPSGEPRPVAILGTGLSMVDRWLSLRRGGYSGPILALSRHGLLPEPHANVTPLPINENEIPIGATPLALMRWLRQRIAEHMAAGGDWRQVTDGLRPVTQNLWRAWDDQARRQFLRHVRAHWDVRRHRLAPAVDARLWDEIAAGSVSVVAARVVIADPAAGAQRIAYRRRSSMDVETLDVAAVLDCRGLRRDLSAGSGLPARLAKSRRARPDAQHIGLDVTPDCRVIGADGRASDRLFAVGPLTRGTFFEIEAVPDIRVQCRDLADMLVTALAIGARPPIC